MHFRVVTPATVAALMRIVFAGLVTIAALAVAAPAEACTLYRPPRERLAQAFRDNVISAAALVTVQASRHTGKRFADSHPWTAVAAIDQTAYGTVTAKTITFDGGRGSAACDDGYPAPRPGARWVAYFWTRPDGRQDLWGALPASVAAQPHMLPWWLGGALR